MTPAGVAGRLVGAYPSRTAGTRLGAWPPCLRPARRMTRRHLVFAGFQQQVVNPVENIIVIVVVVLIVLFVVGYFGRGRFRG